MKYIFLGSRIAAYIIDYIPFIILNFSLSGVGIGGYIGALVFLFLYRYITSACFGATPGMMLLKLKLKNYGFKICLKREIYRFSSSLFYIGYLYGLIDSHSRTFHDIISDTYVIYSESKEVKRTNNRYMTITINVLLAVSILRWSSYFILNDVGLIGLKKVYSSDEYYQNFQGDNLLSLSQDELYMKTLGRRYTTVIDMKGKTTLIRISNKQSYIEVYRLYLNNRKIAGDYLYKIDMPIQYICSGRFRDNKELCGVSPQNNIVLVDEKGGIYAQEKLRIGSILMLMCGDIDSDSMDEAIILGRGGDIEVFEYNNNRLERVYYGKVGEDIVPQSFYINKGLVILGRGHGKSVMYFYDFKDKKFIFRDKKYLKAENISMAAQLGDGVLVSHVSRNNMMFTKGNIQRLELYRIDKNVKRIYNFGTRPGRRYSYRVRTLEEAADIDGDGGNEIILKAVGKEDVMGQSYVVEVYRTSKPMLFVNRILSFIEEVLYKQ